MSAWFLDSELSICYNVDQRFLNILCCYCDGTSISYVTWTSYNKRYACTIMGLIYQA